MEKLSKEEKYVSRGVRALVIDVLESNETASAWASRLFPTVPVLGDPTGETAAAFAPVDVLPELPRSQVPIASNLIIDRSGRIRFFELLDSRNFDSQLIRLRGRLDDLLAAEPAAAGIVSMQAPAPIEIAAGQSSFVELRLAIDVAHHIMANPASSEFLVPLTVGLADGDGVSVGAVSYPAAVPFAIADGETLATYFGEVVLEVPIEVGDNASRGARRLRGTLDYQGCNQHACRVPETVEWEVTVLVE